MDFDTISILVRLAWLAGASAFVLGLMRMNSPATARNGNLLSAGGIAIAVGAPPLPFFFLPHPNRPGAVHSPSSNVILVRVLHGGGAGPSTALGLWRCPLAPPR